jgi:lantibiotic modifying enzyme
LYPSLRPIFFTIIDNWSKFVADFLVHAEAFVRLPIHGVKKPLITDIRFDLSDFHKGGRTVVRVAFEDSKAWYYKRRSGRREQTWGQILNAVNTAGFSAPLLAAEIVCKRNHCWMREIPHRPCRSAAEVDRFYFRIGGVLFLAHVLRAVDLHAGNFIAMGEQPVLIDCETLLHPTIAIPPRAPDTGDSILRTGMVRPVYTRSRTDCTSLLGRIADGQHGVFLSGRRVFAKDAVESIAAGFVDMRGCVECIRRRRSWVTAIRSLQSSPTRTIYRPTAFYFRLLTQSLSLELAANEEARGCLLWHRLKDNLCSRRVILSEVKQLLQCDIPVFHRHAARIRPRVTAKEMALALDVLRQSCGA